MVLPWRSLGVSSGPDAPAACAARLSLEMRGECFAGMKKGG